MRNKKRVKEGIRFGMLDTLKIMIAGLVLIEIFANPLSGIFGLSGETQQLCISAMRIVSISFIFAGINIAYQGIYQALDSGLESLVISLLRQAVIILPLAYVFAKIAIGDASLTWLVWLTFPITEIVSAAVAYLLMKRIQHKKLEGMEEA